MALSASSAHAGGAFSLDLARSKGLTEFPYGEGTARLQVSSLDDDRFPDGIVVEIDGFAPHRVGIDDGPWVNYGQWAGTISLSGSREAPSIMFEAYSGGAHCCSLLRVITPVDGALLSIAFEPAEGELRAKLPSDIDGDGIVDIVRESEHVCRRAACTARNAIYNIVDGKRIDVTSEPRFQAYLAQLPEPETR
ncbi:hypothetical protein LH20_06075 [Sphingopyxis sp. 113P3]|nr:hypothetical protein LH20_06075 [Sphingopyxis sp. 113P3]